MKWRGGIFQKKNQKNDSEDNPGSEKQNGEDARNVYKDLQEWKSDLEDRMVEITATEQKIETRMKKMKTV